MPSLTEPEAVDLVLHALVRAFQDRRQATAGASRTHLTKTVFRLADEFELPITRCWFKFGQYVTSPLVTPEHLAQVRDFGVGALASRIATDLQGEAARLQTRARELVPFFFEPLQDFLPDYYRREAPEPYQGIYASNFEMVSFLTQLPREDDNRGLQTHYADIAGPLVTKFHRAAASLVKDEEARTLVVEYTSFLEELVIRYDRADPSLDVSAWRRLVARAVQAYQDSIWNLPAAQIASETVVGPESEEVRSKMLHAASLGSQYRRDVFEPLRDEAEVRGFLPTEDDLRGLVADAKNRTATRAEAIEEFAHLARQGD